VDAYFVTLFTASRWNERVWIRLLLTMQNSKISGRFNTGLKYGRGLNITLVFSGRCFFRCDIMAQYGSLKLKIYAETRYSKLKVAAAVPYNWKILDETFLATFNYLRSGRPEFARGNEER